MIYEKTRSEVPRIQWSLGAISISHYENFPVVILHRPSQSPNLLFPLACLYASSPTRTAVLLMNSPRSVEDETSGAADEGVCLPVTFFELRASDEISWTWRHQLP